MLVAIKNYDYYKGQDGPILRLICCNEQQERIILDIQDVRLAPRFNILESDYELAKQVIQEANLYHLVYDTKPGLPTALDEPTVEIYTVFPEDIYRLKEAIKGIDTYNGDIKWEKMCIEKLKWKQFIEVTDYDPYGLTSLDCISPSDKMFEVKYNICYWDIETNHSQVKGIIKDAFKVVEKIPIISYVTFNPLKKVYTYYAWKPDWFEEEYIVSHTTDLSDEVLARPTFRNYDRQYPVIVKKFKSEIHMHQQFLEDFSICHYDGIMTFNGRGGVRIVGGERKWFNGYDMPMFYNRCISLGLHKELQKLSPIPVKIKGNKVYDESVKVHEQGEKYEVFIKCIPQHDLYFDDMILFYSKNEHEMKKHNLDTFMSHFLGIHKVEHEGEMVWELFERDWELERHYNIVDVEGMYALDTLFRYTTDVAGRALAYGGKIEDGVYASKIHDHINLWYTSDQYVMDSRDNERKISWKGLLAKKTGGFNLEAIPGAHGYHKKGFGFIIDFSKLYPSCAMTANCDLRTKINVDHMELDEQGLYLVDTKNRRFLFNDLARSPSGFFRKDILSLNTIIYSDFIRMRKVYSKKMAEFGEMKAHAKTQEEKDYAQSMYNIFYAQQFSYKGLTNGKYGADGLEGTRNYDLVIYNTPPSMGQLLIKKVISFLEERNYMPLLASTDSVIVMANADTAMGAFEEASKLCEILNNEILPPYVMQEFNPIKSYVSIDCEKVFDMAIIFDKRRYMLNTVLKEEGGRLIEMEKPEAYYRGMEYVRRDTAMITHDVQDTLMNMIRFRKPKDEIIAYVKEVDEKFEKMPWNYICPRAGISNDVEQGTGQKYTACRNANLYFDKEYNAGSNPLLGVFTKHPNFLHGKYIEPGKLPMAFEDEEEFMLKKKGFDLDYTHLKEVHLIKKVEPFLQLLFNKTYEQIVTMMDDTFDW